MAHVSRRLALVRDAIEIVVRRLSTLPPSPELEELRLRAEECLRQADGWAHRPPTVEEREAVMKRVLGLHTAVVRLERKP
jgi:hypothetical protein